MSNRHGDKKKNPYLTSQPEHTQVKRLQTQADRGVKNISHMSEPEMNLRGFYPRGAPGVCRPTAKVNSWWESIFWIPFF